MRLFTALKSISQFLAFLILISCSGTSEQKQQTAQTQRPNIVLIIADDIGYSDIGPYGAEIETPNLDRLANEGVRFTNFYNMSKCETTRSSLMTGLYQGNHTAASMPQLLRQGGYYNIISGKEHFSRWVPDRCYAVNSFDQSFTFWATTEYFIPPSGELSRPFILNGDTLEASELPHEKEPFYKTDAITWQGLKWLDDALAQDADRPFFLYLPFHSAHYPLQARPEDIAKYRGKYLKGWDKIRQERFERQKALGVIPANATLSEPTSNINKFRGHPNTPGDEERRENIPLYRPWESLSDAEKEELDLEMAVFAAMIDRLDQNIGRVLQKLEEAGVADNTLVMFFTDNGSCPFDSNKDFENPPGPAEGYRTLSAAWANVGNTPFKYFKQFGHEGGSHTHCIARWPAVIEPNTITDQQAHLVDIMPTFLEMAQVEYPSEIDGQPTPKLHGNSLMPVFKGEERPRPDYIISGFTERFRMFRQGDWKIVRLNGEEGWELYNLAQDPTETNNLANEFPERVMELSNNYQNALAGFPQP